MKFSTTDLPEIINTDFRPLEDVIEPYDKDLEGLADEYILIEIRGMGVPEYLRNEVTDYDAAVDELEKNEKAVLDVWTNTPRRIP